MRLESVDSEDSTRMIGAAVIRKVAGNDLLLDLGPADGPPLVRLRMDFDEAQELSASIRNVAETGIETVIILDS